MTIDVKYLKEQIKAYNDLIEEYEGDYLNYYNMLSSFSFFWNDQHAKRFYSNLPKEKLNCKNLVGELRTIRDVYKYMINKYSEFGNHIKIDLKEKDRVINKFDSYIDKANSIINKFNNLNLGFCPNEAYRIRQVRDNVIECRDAISEKRKSVKECFEKISNIEREINHRIQIINTTIVKETSNNGLY